MLGKFLSPKLVSLDVNINSCNVHLGDFVTPRTVVGSGSENGTLVQAKCYGTVTAIHYRGASPTMTVVVQTEGGLLG